MLHQRHMGVFKLLLMCIRNPNNINLRELQSLNKETLTEFLVLQANRLPICKCTMPMVMGF